MEIFNVTDINLAEQLGYDCVPEEVEEWSWIAEYASFTHKDNGESGVWEFMVSLTIFENEPHIIPVSLLSMFKEAASKQSAYILFNQGC
jgi:hypothetical protein